MEFGDLFVKYLYKVFLKILCIGVQTCVLRIVQSAPPTMTAVGLSNDACQCASAAIAKKQQLGTAPLPVTVYNEATIKGRICLYYKHDSTVSY